ATGRIVAMAGGGVGSDTGVTVVDRPTFSTPFNLPAGRFGATTQVSRVTADGLRIVLNSLDSLVPEANPPELNIYVMSLDLDHDGMPDWWETRFGLNPNDPTDAPLDADGDGATNLQEYLQSTN